MKMSRLQKRSHGLYYGNPVSDAKLLHQLRSTSCMDAEQLYRGADVINNDDEIRSMH